MKRERDKQTDRKECEGKGMGNHKVAIVTGAGSGVGRAVALTMAKEGYKLVVVGRSTGNTTETANMVKELGAEVTAVIADIGSEADTIKYVDAAIQVYGRIDVYVNSAARFQPYMHIHEIDEELFDDIMKINVKGAFFGMKHVLKHMVEQKSGVIVNVGSMDGLQSEPMLGAYSTSKHAMVGLTKNAATEYGHMGIRTCCVCPGAIQTKMIAEVLETLDPEVLGPMRRAADPQEIADVVCYLASDKATYLNGAIIRANGGKGL